MTDIYYFKLVSGEDLIAESENPQEEDSKTLQVENPMLVQYFSDEEGGYQAGMRPWIPGMLDKTTFTLHRTHIMFMARVDSDEVMSFYGDIVERENAQDYEHVIEEAEEYNELMESHSNTLPTKLH